MAYKTPKGRVTFPRVFVPKEYKGKEKYEITLIFDSNTDVSELKRIAAEAAKKEWPNKLPANLKSPVRPNTEAVNGETGERYRGYEDDGGHFICFRNDRQPEVVDASKHPIDDKAEIYSGCYARVSFNPSAYNVDGNKGVTFYLNNVQKLADGDRLDSSTSADDDFDAVEEEDVFA